MNWRPSIGAGLLVLLGLGAYLPSLPGEYVYDDFRFVALNPAVERGATAGAWFTDPATQTADGSWTGLYRPLRTLSYRAVRALGGGAGAQRAAGIVLHLLNGLTVFAVLGRLGASSRAGRLAGTAVFLFHPLAVESAAWVSSRGDVLSVSFCLLALWAHVATDRRSGAAAVAGLFALALWSKESALFLPGVLALVDLSRGRFAGGRWRGRVPVYALCAAVLGIFCAVRASVLGGASFGQPGGAGLDEGALVRGVLGAHAYYGAALVAPWWLSFEFRMVPSAEVAAAGFAALALLVAGGVLAWRRARMLSLGLLAVPLSLLPVTVLQFLFPLRILVANRFAYPALIGAALVAGACAARGRRAAALVGVVATCFLALSAIWAGRFRDSERLWTAVLARDAENPVALFGLGTERLKTGDPEAARLLLVRAARQEPGNPRLAVFLGTACLQTADRRPNGSPEWRARVVEAQSAFHHAIRLWQGGVTDDLQLFRTALLEGAYLSALVGRGDIARDHIEVFLRQGGEISGGATGVSRVRALSKYFSERGEPEIAGALASLAEYLERGGRP